MLSKKMVRFPTRTAMKVLTSTVTLETAGNGPTLLEALRKEKKLWQILQRSESCLSGQSSFTGCVSEPCASFPVSQSEFN